MAYIKIDDANRVQAIGALSEVLSKGLEDGEEIYKLKPLSDFKLVEKLRELDRPLSPREQQQVDAQNAYDHYRVSTIYGP